MIIKTDSNHRVLHSCFALFLAFIALFISGQAQAKTYTYIVGNKIPDTNKYGPTTDVVWAKPRQMGKTVAYHDESALREIVVYDWGSNDTDEGGGNAFCNSTNNNDTPLTIRRGFGTPAGKTPDGHDMWKTNVEGLYFAFEIYSLYTAWSTLNTSLPIWLDQTDTPIHFTPTDSLKTACNNTIINTYAVVGGIGFSVRIHMYVDGNFKPNRSSNITDVDFLHVDGYDFMFYNPTTPLDASHRIKFSFDTSGFNAVWPSCTASTISGPNVKGSTLNFGSYYPKQIIDGLDAVPFQINLSNCSYIKSIEVKLTSTAIGKDTTLLSNTLTDDTAASGIGVLIQGVKNNNSNQMVLVPGDANSIYRQSPYATPDAYIDSANEYPTNTLSFLATLKHDSNKTITPGSFKATGTFQMTYP
ncbi:fimbrial protein [Salmonella enterica subsp. salamae]|uniref:Fimbrial protein n=2 Tax=Salmonella enterica TaxID=28901 RepID=A0A6C7CH82_SALER|nr:fimbrial protein [Salmonella enterica subsp. salamae serovar 55:k:z39 str. 1315K]ECC1480537.1 fimbrial protein [Salmonella enterica subsp. salamae]EEL7719041.1 fimbrial protein [Salmonella enterica]ECC1654748.1 fimbrial protein [Salmonella enterica subsp. salamae]ECD9413014.1 fimbrial protein [Salmonella enterica subsp. salamae]